MPSMKRFIASRPLPSIGNAKVTRLLEELNDGK